MALDESIQKEISKLSLNKDQDGIVSYLRRQLKENKATAQDIFDYAKGYRWDKKEGKPYVISASAINKLGVAVGELEDQEQKKLRIEFFKLAAERDSSWGNKNCVSYFLTGNKSCGVKKSPEQALLYAEKAVALAKGNKDEEHEHKLVYAKALRESKKYVEANKALMEYLLFKEKECRAEKNEESRKKIEKEVDAAIELCKRIIEELKDDLSVANLVKERVLNNLQELEPILCAKLQHAGYLALKQEAYFVKAKHHEILEEFDKAMLAHCAVTDTKLAFYADSVSARGALLKRQIRRIVQVPPLPFDVVEENAVVLENNVVVEHKEEEKAVLHKRKRQDFVLPGAIPFSAHFSKSWKAGASWFHSVDQEKLEAEFKKRDGQVDALIVAKKIEIDLIEELIKNTPDSAEKKVEGEGPLERKKILKGELEKLEKVKQELEKEYDAYLPDCRGVFRRYAAEGQFFNPDRSKKKEALIALIDAIIDQRFRLTNAAVPPVELPGNSARLLITAERLFQKAVIDLTGEENPRLGIPTVREKPWVLGHGWNERSGVIEYGPVEHYKIGDTTVESEHRTSPKRQRLGDSFFPQHGTYDSSICPFLLKLSANDGEKEKRIASLIICYGKNQQSISLEELQNIYEDATDEDVNTFNQICFLIMAKEQGQWHSATKETHQLGMSVAQARCLIMMEAGFLRFKEAFKNDVLFGVYSQKKIVDNPEDVSKACRRIDELYMRYLQMQPENVQSSIGFFKKHIDSAVQPSCVLTREQAHQDMLQVYGGEDESDGDGYESDLSM